MFIAAGEVRVRFAEFVQSVVPGKLDGVAPDLQELRRDVAVEIVGVGDQLPEAGASVKAARDFPRPAALEGPSEAERDPEVVPQRVRGLAAGPISFQVAANPPRRRLAARP